MLGDYLQEVGCTVIHAEGDADVLIAQRAVQSSMHGPTTIIGEDTDLLVLLCFHADQESFHLYLQSDKRSSSKKLREWDIHWIRKKHCVQTSALCFHLYIAVRGCETTSKMHGIGKGMPLRKLKSDPHFIQQAEVFMNTVSKEEIFHAGEQALLCLYGGTVGEGLDALCYRRFCEKVCMSASPVQVHTLPPTSASAIYHSACVYYQVHEWMGEQHHYDPKDWGWDEVQNQIRPLITNMAAAPKPRSELSDAIAKQTVIQGSTCKKHELDCSVACGESIKSPNVVIHIVY